MNASKPTKVKVHYIMVEGGNPEVGPGEFSIEPRCNDHASAKGAVMTEELLATVPEGASKYDYAPVHCEENSCHKIIGFTELGEPE